MPRIKHTKNELKTQREDLQRFNRFLPMLQLKKQLLQAEVQHIRAKIATVRKREQALLADIQRWIRIFADPFDPADYLAIASVQRSESNVAGVNVPVFEQVVFQRQPPDPFATPPWIDAALTALEQLLSIREEAQTLAEQERRITAELHTTAQRVNLFEKVKIPATLENIRVIKIFLGDEQTAGVARAKIAKDRLR